MSAVLDSIGCRARRGEPLSDIGVIDAHGHVGSWHQFPMRHSEAEAVLRVMDRIGIARIAVSSTPAAIGVETRVGNDMVIDAVRRFPDRFFGYIAIYPGSKERTALQEVKRCEAAGLRAAKIHTFHCKPYTSPESSAGAR